MSFAEISSVHTIKYPYLVNLSTIINIISCSCPVIGSFNFNNLTIKSYNITSYGYITNFTSYNFLYGLCLFGLFF